MAKQPMNTCRALIVSLLVLGGSLAVVGQQAGGGLLIRNGRLVDGTGGPSRAADVRIEGDAIVEVGPSLSPRTGERVIDATGRVVAPGFIDMHSHADGGLAESPDAATQLRQGITTTLVGQDGGGELPVADLADRVGRVKPAINLATSVGHGTVRRLVMGEDFRRAATPAEIETMKALVERGMKDGAVGLSSGLEYDPGFYATTDELAALATSIRPYGGFYSSHVRDEENEYLAAWKEAIDVGRRAGVAVEISHMKLASKPVWGRAKEGLAMLDAARREGLTVMGDWYPYPYWQSAMYVLIPDREFENVEKWRVGLDEIGGAGNVRITNYRADPSWNGKTLAELAATQNIDPPSLIVSMVKAEGPAIGIIGTSMDEADMKAILAHPQVLICSDGQLSGRHPRGYGAFPRVLARYVREQQAISLEEAIAKMTSRSAAMLGLADRGVVAAGKKADVVIFDAATIADRGTPQEPAQAPVGLDTVIVNGQVVLDRGEVTGARPGRALRRTGARPR
ncbi:MAG: D-aminoacylase [Vicinamibacteria bacterium]|nr:D-aminoacylase [Vicinamibacteria bacterium]